MAQSSDLKSQGQTESLFLPDAKIERDGGGAAFCALWMDGESDLQSV
ncbi:MAG TPA: hypothetical protein VHW45_11015 [Candidatus Sulfotelmatobacter sp.]|jgi:hypothetical protein|nr:hypothetical protein [Candidatus Sulfotelmatobacter sp.]